jgi:hypothetical protein
VERLINESLAGMALAEISLISVTGNVNLPAVQDSAGVM